MDEGESEEYRAVGEVREPEDNTEIVSEGDAKTREVGGRTPARERLDCRSRCPFKLCDKVTFMWEEKCEL